MMGISYKKLVQDSGVFVLDCLESRPTGQPRWFVGRGRVAGNAVPIPSGLHATPRQAWKAAAEALGLTEEEVMGKVSCTGCGQRDGAHAAGCFLASEETKFATNAAKTNEGAKEAPEVGKKVPHVTVNGRVLTGSEVMTAHTALRAFFFDLENNGLGNDETAWMIAQGYKRCLQNIFRLMDL